MASSRRATAIPSNRYISCRAAEAERWASLSEA